ncbi:MAG: pirin family protein [Acidocella sp.]|nr:pirin family protein [Acidocella sp.]
MIEVRGFSTLGAFKNEWLNARHHFSFGQYRDPARTGFGALVVWNDDEIAPQTGFGAHPHRDMEIITFVRAGAITHKDSLGNVGVTRAGDVQVMHAGTGITHAEMNQEHEATRLFQIWIRPDEMGVRPGWGAREMPRAAGDGLQILASGRAADRAAGALPLYADAAVMAARLRTGEVAHYHLPEGRAAYLVAASGEVLVNGHLAGERDGVAIIQEPEIKIEARGEVELVLVDVASRA